MEDYTIKDTKPGPQNPDTMTHEYTVKLSLSEEKQKELLDEILKEFTAIKDERSKSDLEAIWKQCDNLYNGKLRANERFLFNLHVHQSKIKEDAIVRAINEAFLDSDPMVDVNPRPESAREGADEIARKQTEFIDYSIDEEVRPEESFILINRSAVRKYVGIGKLCWEYKREPRKREEVYVGENIVTGITPDGQVMMDNPGLRDFLRNYPDAETTYPHYLQQLMDGKKINIVTEYFEIVNNSPKLKYVPVENFFVRKDTCGYDGLCCAHLIVELKSYTYWELKEKERLGEFVNVEKVISKVDGTGQVKPVDTTKSYEIMECTYYADMGDKEGRREKIRCWIYEEAKVYLGGIHWPYYAIDIDYVPFYVKKNDMGFYGGGMSVLYDLKDSNIAQDALLNLALHGTYIRNVVTPILKEGSEMERIFMEKKFREGMPIVLSEFTEDVSKSFDFVRWPSMNLDDMVGLTQLLKKQDSDVTGVTDLMTGRESPTDPSAPATKTIALLNQSGLNIKDYIRVYLPSFNVFVTSLLALYYQMSEVKKYRVNEKSQKVSGIEAFSMITREEMAARTVIQSRAASFAFDKMNEKQENMAMYEILMSNPYVMQQPELLYKALVTLMMSWSPRWKNIAEADFPSPQEFAQQMRQVAAQAVADVMAQQQQDAGLTGVEPELDEEQTIQQIAQRRAAAYNPALAQEQQ